MSGSNRNRRPGGGAAARENVQAPTLNGPESSPTESVRQADYYVTITDGRDTAGYAAECSCGRWEAITADGRTIGMYPSRQAATTAVLTARGVILG